MTLSWHTGHKANGLLLLGSAQYSREELIAEMTAAFVCASLSIVPTVRHADYIGSWIKLWPAGHNYSQSAM